MLTKTTQPAAFPNDLLSQSPTFDSQRTWLVAHTRPRQEKKLIEELFCKGIAYYLPLVQQSVVSRGRRRVKACPLFPGYVFLFCRDHERVPCLRTNRICQVLDVGDSEQLVAELRDIQRLISINAPLTIESRLKQGDRVRVRYGPLMGVEGTIIRRQNGGSRLVVAVKLLQQGVSVDIDDYLLEYIG